MRLLCGSPLCSLFGGALAVLGLLMLAVPTPIHACGGTPPPPRCGKTLVLAKATPPTVILPGGGTFPVPSTVFFNLVGFPGSGVCPVGPYTVDVTYTATCAGGPGGTGTVVGVPITPGAFTPVPGTITVPAGPPRLCTIVGTATSTLSDGMVLTATGDAQVCLVEEAPGQPGVPRLDLDLLAPGSEIVGVHPGDQASFVYRVTNNDPTEDFTGSFASSLTNSARLPGASGPMPPGTGPFALSDPGQGDNFPIGFESDLVGTCLPLPLPDPANPIVPRIEEPFVLGPGESRDFEIFIRPWGMCADGSCGEGKVTIEGLYGDGSSGLACNSYVVQADASVPPTFDWPSSGSVAGVPPSPQPNVLPLLGQPLPGQPVVIEFVTAEARIQINGQPLPQLLPDILAGPVTDFLGRTQVQLVDPLNPLGDPNLFFEAEFSILMQPPPGDTPWNLRMAELLPAPGAPTGFDQLAPYFMGLIEVRAPDTLLIDSFFDITYQLSGVAIDETDARRDLLIDTFELSRLPSGFQVRATGTVSPGLGNQILALEFAQDLRGFASKEPQIVDPSVVFKDSFESGNTIIWSETFSNNR
ncbi:MAG: hypothetical protein AAF772_00600 [Acidobacteriota bacterium]